MQFSDQFGDADDVFSKPAVSEVHSRDLEFYKPSETVKVIMSLSVDHVRFSIM